MDLKHPFRIVTPTLDGEVLRTLAGTTRALTGRQVERLVGDKSHEGIRRVLARLVEQGIVSQEPAGPAFHYRLNREHLAAPYVEGIASLRLRLIEMLRTAIGNWTTPPSLAVLFGSAGRGEASTRSDLDVLVIRPRGVDPDDQTWRDQLDQLATEATCWTGNDTRFLEYGEEEVEEFGEDEPPLRAAAGEGVALYGSLHSLRRLPGNRDES